VVAEWDSAAPTVRYREYEATAQETVPEGSGAPMHAIGRYRASDGPGSQDPDRYLMCTPEMAREMISRWISLVPSKMVKIFESRCQRSTGYSRT